MINFYIGALALIVLALLFVLVPFIKRTKQQRMHVSNANVIKQRMLELEDDVKHGLISEKDKNTAINELKLALVDETQASDDADIKEVSKTSKLTVLLSIPAIAVGIWVFYQGNQLSALDEYLGVIENVDELTSKMTSGNRQDITPDDVAKYSLLLRERLRETPDDAKGWMFSGTTQLSIGRVEQALAAFEKSLEIAPQDDNVRYRYVNALISAGTQETLQSAKRQLDFLISKNPAERQYRLLQTVVAAQLGDAQLAAENFLMIRDQMAVDSDLYVSLVTQLRTIGVSDEVLGEPVTEANQTSIDVNISIAPILQSKIPESGYLIVFAQDGVTDSKVPLAVRRMAIPDFPATIKLSTADAMMANQTLDNTGIVRITARISTDADVALAPGELQGITEQVALELGQRVTTDVMINQEIK